jgi:hypothetical protein
VGIQCNANASIHIHGSPHVRRPVNAAPLPVLYVPCQARSQRERGLCQLSRGMHAHVAGGGSEVLGSSSRALLGREHQQGEMARETDPELVTTRVEPSAHGRLALIAVVGLLASLIKAFGTACLMTCFCDLHACTG